MNILVIGDIMVDTNFVSRVERKAPEADIPIYDVEKIYYLLGGGANVAKNLHDLNTNVELVSVIGNDFAGNKIKNLLDEQQMNYTLFVEEERRTTQKNRIFCENNLSVRYDIEIRDYIDEETEKSIIEYITTKKEKLHAIVISDYDKGVISPSLCQKIIDYCNTNNIYTFVDPKIKNVNKYKNCFCFKPNLNEGEIISKETTVGNILKTIKTTLSPNHIILTCGEKGIYVDDVEQHITHPSTIEVVDVTGAGDIVLCILVYIFLQEKNLFLATKIANYIAGKSVQQQGNYTTSIQDINDYYEMEQRENESKQEQIITIKKTTPENKIIFDYETDKILELSKLKNTVFTNGCFDIIHSAHIQNLTFAKAQGECLIVGLNADESVRRLKGKERPINHQEERSKLLSLFDFVDYIILFQEDTPLSILQILCPSVIVKGSDYKKEEIVGAEYAEKIVLFDYIEGKSSSIVVNKIKTFSNI
jgi:D-beta-D-heptose 7-phosphate kinase/D-beta-D-heptose 1-phosphate adenosyltransferase